MNEAPDDVRFVVAGRDLFRGVGCRIGRDGGDHRRTRIETDRGPKRTEPRH